MKLETKLKHALRSKNEDKIHTIFEEIYVTFGKLVYFKILQYVPNFADAEELTQDVFVSFYNNIYYSEISNIKYYLVTSAKNKAIDYIKKKKINFIYDENFIYNKEEYTNNPNFYEILAKMNTILNQTEIDIILKHLIDGYTFKDLSKAYNKPINTILSIYHRGLIKFKKGSEINERK